MVRVRVTYYATTFTCEPQLSLGQVVGWGMEPKSDVEATPPPDSPACTAAGACGPLSKVLLVPHGSTALRIGSFPVA